MERVMVILGKKKQVNCTDDMYYQFLGYVANHPDDIAIVFEHNETSGAWGSEGRIQFKSDVARQYFSQGFGFSAGIGNILYRLNCNELINKMWDLGFVQGSLQDIQAIRNNIPTNQQANFDIGAAI